MPIGLAIAAGVAAATGIAKLGVGIAQRRKGKKLEEATERPDYEIPEEIFQNLNQAQQMALQGLPAEQKQQYIQNLQQSGQFALSQMGSRKAGLTGVAQLNQQQQFGFQNMLAMDAQARQQNQMQVMQQRQNVAGFRDQAFQLNQLNPFYEDTARAQALQGAGMQNIMGGLNTIGGAAITYGSGIDQGVQGLTNVATGGMAGGLANQKIAQNQQITNPTTGYNTPGITDPQLTGVIHQQQPYSLKF